MHKNAYFLKKTEKSLPRLPPAAEGYAPDLRVVTLITALSSSFLAMKCIWKSGSALNMRWKLL